MAAPRSLIPPSCLILAGILLGAGGEAGAPRGIHLSWADSSPEVLTVTWVTNTPAGGSRARYRKFLDREVREAEAVTSRVPGLASHYLHRAVIGPLKKGSAYFYQVGESATDWSPAIRLRLAPASASAFTFVVAADMGTSPDSAASLAQMAKADPAFVLVAGDLAYARGVPEAWDAWFDKVEPLAARVPFMAAIGNHDYEEGTGLSAYLGRLAFPHNGRYYSFDYGNLHVISLDSGSSYGEPPPAMTAWLESDLRRNAADPDHPWTVVFFHFPPYSSGRHGSWMKGRETLSPLFDRYGVELVLNGHDHSYERTWPVDATGSIARKDYTDPRAPVYVVTGGAGIQLYSYLSPQPDWSAFRASERETLRVTVEGVRMAVTAVRPDGTRLDGFTITRTVRSGLSEGTPALPDRKD